MFKRLIACICLVSITTAVLSQTVRKQWKLFSPATSAKFITWDWNNKMYIIDMKDELQENFTISGRGNMFAPALPQKKIKDINFAPDGSALALDIKDSLGFRRTGGKWETQIGIMAMSAVTMEGNKCWLTMEGDLIKNGIKDPSGKYRYICAISNGNGLLSIKQDGEVNYLGNPPKAKYIAADSSGVGHIFLLSAGADAAIYYLDFFNGKNLWTKLPSSQFMRFIAMDRKGVLHGIGTDNRMYYLAD